MAKFVPQAELPVSEQAQIRRDKLAALQAEGRDPFLITKFDFNTDSAAIKADYDAFEEKDVKVAGRLMSKRGQGKVMFCDLQDSTGRIQLFVKIDEMGEEEFNRFKKNDIGDIVGAEGEVFKTKTGEISIRGRVLPIGGLKEKTMAAMRHGIHTVIIPKDNERDLEEIDQTVRNALHFVIAETIDVVLETALNQKVDAVPTILKEIPSDVAQKPRKAVIQQ